MAKVTVSDATTLEKRLVAICDEPLMRERLYPALIQRAGTTITPEGAALLVELAMTDYLEGMPFLVVETAQMFRPMLIEAMLQ